MRSSRASVLSLLLIALSVLSPVLIALAAESARAEALGWSWQRSRLFPGLGEASALAFDPDTDRLAVGDEGGVWLFAEASGPTRVLRRGPVRDLAFGPGTGLYAATDRGLFHIDAVGDVSRQSLGAGAGAVRRVLVTPEFVLVATDRGAFLSRAGRSWSRLDAGLPAGAVDAFAVRPLPDGADLWLIVEGAVQRATLRSGADRLALDDVTRVSIPGGGGRRDAVDLSTAIPGAEVAVLTRRGFLLYQEGSWESFRPTFPPGATPVRFGYTTGRLWIATDRGLLEAASPSGPWHRAAPPVGNTPVAVLVGGEPLAYAAGA
jgi:ligand-binding sensor domain-containing protein